MNNHKLKIQSECPFCGKQYDLSSLRVISERPQGLLAHLTCSVCRGSIITFVSVSAMGTVTATGVATDLAEDEVLKFEKGKTVSADEVIEIHELLKKGRLDVGNW